MCADTAETNLLQFKGLQISFLEAPFISQPLSMLGTQRSCFAAVVSGQAGSPTLRLGAVSVASEVNEVRTGGHAGRSSH